MYGIYYLIPPLCSWTHLLYQCIVLQDFARLHDTHNGSLQKQFSILVHGVDRVLHLIDRLIGLLNIHIYIYIASTHLLWCLLL